MKIYLLLFIGFADPVIVINTLNYTGILLTWLLFCFSALVIISDLGVFYKEVTLLNTVHPNNNNIHT